jgi:hypothetical protein
MPILGPAAVGAAGLVLGEGLFRPLNDGEAEWQRRRDLQKNAVPTGSTPAPSVTAPVQTSTPIAPMPIEPIYQGPNAPEQRSKEQQQFEQQQQQWKQEQQKQEDLFQAQQAAFKAQQTAWKKLQAKQEKLSRFSSVGNEDVKSFENQLTPQQKGALNKEVKARYGDLTSLAQQADSPLMPYEVTDIQQKLRQQVLYERFVPVREIYHFGGQFLNGYTPQKMKMVRGYFDQVFEGKYSKSISADKKAVIIQSADAKYTEETGKKPNREDILWKTYRNVEATEKFPDLWDQFRDDLSKAPSQQMGIVKGQPLPPLGGFGEGSSIAPELLKPETFPSGGATLPPLRGFGEGPQPKISNVMLSQSIPWKPSMTEDEARIYTGEGYYKERVFYHGTNRNGANSIASGGVNSGMFDELSTYGPGFYVGNDQNIARNYAKRKQEETGQEGAVLSVMLNAKKPKVFSSGIEYTRAVNAFVRQSGNINEEWNVAFNNYLRKQGYDSIELLETGYTVVFDKEQVVTIGNEVIK